MTNVNFYTRDSAIAKIGQDTGKAAPDGLKDAIRGLNEHKVARSKEVVVSAAPRLGPAPDPTGGIMASLGKSQAKARGISDFFTKDPVKRSFAERLNNAQHAKALKPLLHYGGSQSSKGAAARLETRAALSLAFAQGASIANLGRLRVFLDDAPPDIRRNVRQELNRTDVDADAFIEKLVDPDEFHPAKVPDAVLSKSLKGLDKAYRGEGALYVEKNYARLGLEHVRGEGTVRANATFAALVAYCGNDFREMNRAMRSSGGVEEGLRLKIDLATHALSEMPEFQGISLRGAELGEDILARYEPGETVTEKAFTSSSANSGFEGNAQFIIEGRHGRNIAELSPYGGGNDGTEILFPPNTSFEVLHKEDVGGTTYIVMREVEG